MFLFLPCNNYFPISCSGTINTLNQIMFTSEQLISMQWKVLVIRNINIMLLNDNNVSKTEGHIIGDLNICYFENTELGSSNIEFLERKFSVKSSPPSKPVFHQRISSIEGFIARTVFFNQSLSSIKGYLTSEFVFHHRSSPIKFCFHQRSCHQTLCYCFNPHQMGV